MKIGDRVRIVEPKEMSEHISRLWATLTPARNRIGTIVEDKDDQGDYVVYCGMSLPLFVPPACLEPYDESEEEKK